MAIAAAKLSLAVKKVEIGKPSGVPAPSKDFAKKLDQAIQKTDGSEESSATSETEQAQNKPQELPKKASDAPVKKGDGESENFQTEEDSSHADAADAASPTPPVPSSIPVQQADQADDDQSDAQGDKPAKETPKSQQAVTPDAVVIQQPVQPKAPNPQNTEASSDQEKQPADVLAADKRVAPANVNVNDTNAGEPVARGEMKDSQDSKQGAVKRTGKDSDQVDDSQGQDPAVVQTKGPKTAAKPQAVAQAPDAQSKSAQNADTSSPDETTADAKQTSSKPDFDQILQMRMPEKPVEQASNTPATPQPQNINIEQRFIDTNHPQIISGVRGQLMPHGGTLHLRLDPPELGAMNVTMKIDDGTVTASFQTTNSEATRLLSHSLGDLKNGLESAGVSVDKLHVTQVSHDQMNSNDFDQRGSSQQGSSQQQQEQQRREMMRRLWRKVSGGDPLDLVA